MEYTPTYPTKESDGFRNIYLFIMKGNSETVIFWKRKREGSSNFLLTT